VKRFYKSAAVAAEADGFRVQLDGRGIRTVGGRAQIVPSMALAGWLRASPPGEGWPSSSSPQSGEVGASAMCSPSALREALVRSSGTEAVARAMPTSSSTSSNKKSLLQVFIDW
jgi:hypothetical protein